MTPHGVFLYTIHQACATVRVLRNAIIADMTHAKTNLFKRVFKGLQVLLLVAAFVLMGYLLRKDFQAEQFQTLLQQASFAWLGLALLAAFLGLLFKVQRLKEMAQVFGLPISFRQSFDIQVISISLGIITPGRAGELSKVFLMTETRPEARKKALGLMIIERLMDMLVLACLGGAFLLSWQWSGFVYGLLALGSVVAFLAFFRFWPLLKSVVSAKMSVARLNPGHGLRWLGLSALAWIFDGLFQGCILASVGFFPDVIKLVALNALVAIAGVLSLLPVGLGTVDLSALYLYSHTFQLEQSTIVYLLAAGRVLGLGLLFTLMGLVLLKHPGLYQRLKKRQKQEAD